MKISVSEKVFEKYPDVVIGVVAARGISNTGESEGVDTLMKDVVEKARENYVTSTLSQDQRIGRWREVYSAFGAKPKKYKCSAEALMRRVLSGDDLPKISKLVDLYNALSIRHLLPMGGDDTDKVDGDIELVIAAGGEPFTPLGSTDSEEAREGEIVYRDDREVLCRRWNWRECDKSKLTEETKNVVLYVEGFNEKEVSAARDELAELVEKTCGGEARTFIITKDSKEVVV